jgi:hypothetical protein
MLPSASNPRDLLTHSLSFWLSLVKALIPPCDCPTSERKKSGRPLVGHTKETILFDGDRKRTEKAVRDHQTLKKDQDKLKERRQMGA